VTPALLDASVLIALTDSDHEYHGAVGAWALGEEQMALCPITEGAALRYHLRRGSSVDFALTLLREFEALPQCEFWGDSISYLTADLGHVLGYRQVTDAYLAALAASHPGAVLATLDHALAAAFPGLAVLVTASPGPAQAD
jgi:predicted nucleic acid-binding protein